MSIAVSTIESLIGTYPISLFTAHHWFKDYPTNTNPVFDDMGFFSGGDLPFGLVVELHTVPAGAAYAFLNSLQYVTPYAQVVNNAKLAGGYGGTLPIEVFNIDRPRQLLLFHEPSTTSIYLELLHGATLQVWGLYIDIPLITPTQPAWTTAIVGPTSFDPTFDGTAFAGLFDSGSLALDDGTVAIRVDVTTLPTSLGEEAGDPTMIFDIGWINWGDTIGFETRQRVTGTHWESKRPDPVPRNVLGYSFHAGVVATVTCLQPNF